MLEQNYRSTQTILGAANAVIAQNKGRKPKNLWSEAGDGELIIGYVADNEHDEAQFVAEEIDRLTDEGDAKPSEVAVFYRTNAQSRVFEEVFIRVGLPYKVVGGVRFYERREVRDVLAYLRMLVNPDDTVSLRRILNVPKRGIGDRAEACVEVLAQRTGASYWQALQRRRRRPGDRHPVAEEHRGLRGDDRSRCSSWSTRARGRTRSSTRCSTRAATSRSSRSPTDPQDETRVENLGELVAVAREFTDEQEGATLADFLERVALVADTDQIPDEDEAGGVVTLMTLHTAKGLEFPVVFLTGLEDGIFPHARALGRPAGARGGAPARLRRADPGPAAALRLPGHGSLGLGCPAAQPAVAVPRRDADDADRLEAHRGGADHVGQLVGVGRYARDPTAATSRR